MLKTWMTRMRGGTMLPDQEALRYVIEKFATVVETRHWDEAGLTNFVVEIKHQGETARTNLSFYRSDAKGTHFWKCVLNHGWSHVRPDDVDRSKLQKLAETHVVKSFTAPRAGKISSKFGAEPVGHKINFDRGDVDYSWVFELEPYHWPEQIRAIFNAWDAKIPILDSEVQRIWER